MCLVIEFRQQVDTMVFTRFIHRCQIYAKHQKSAKAALKQQRIITRRLGVGMGVNFSCEARIKVPIAGMSALFTDCQNFAWSRKYDSFNFRAFETFL